MALSSSLFHFHIFILVVCFIHPILCISSHGRPQAALFVFGDSLFDPGNNNYINTTTEYQANWRPYGESFFKYPTGRFSDGRLIPDFIAYDRKKTNFHKGLFCYGGMGFDSFVVFVAEYANLPLIPSYFEIGKQHFVHGVNFASGGAGCLVETHRGFVIDLKTQLKCFKKVTKLLKKKVGATESKQILSNAVYIFSAGGNDYLAPLSTNSSYPQREYLQMIMGNLTSVLKGIYKEGGKKIAMLNMVPIGLLPNIIALNGNSVEKITKLVKMHNLALPEILKQLEKQLPGFKYTLFNFFKVFSDSIDNPTKYGFKTSKTAYCGIGPLRGIYSCGGKREVKKYKLCKNVKDNLFFDSFHPSELAYKQYAEVLWNGTSDVVAPYNLKSFFELSA